MNLEPYRHELDQLDLSEEEKHELVIALRLVAETFADRAFGINREAWWKDEKNMEFVANEGKES